jgi:hypothetical protein
VPPVPSRRPPGHEVPRGSLRTHRLRGRQEGTRWQRGAMRLGSLWSCHGQELRSRDGRARDSGVAYRTRQSPTVNGSDASADQLLPQL